MTGNRSESGDNFFGGAGIAVRRSDEERLNTVRPPENGEYAGWGQQRRAALANDKCGGADRVAAWLLQQRGTRCGQLPARSMFWHR